MPGNTKWFCDKAIWSLSPHIISSVPSTSIRRPSHGKFIYCLANVRLMAHHTSRHLLIIVCTFQVLIQRESFIFCQDLWNSWDHGCVVFSMAANKVLARPWRNFDLFRVLLKAARCLESQKYWTFCCFRCKESLHGIISNLTPKYFRFVLNLVCHGNRKIYWKL